MGILENLLRGARNKARDVGEPFQKERRTYRDAKKNADFGQSTAEDANGGILRDVI